MTKSVAAPEIFQIPLDQLGAAIVPPGIKPGSPEFEQAVIMRYATKLTPPRSSSKPAMACGARRYRSSPKATRRVAHLWHGGTTVHGWSGGAVCGVVAGAGKAKPAL